MNGKEKHSERERRDWTVILIILLALLPQVMDAGIAYITAILIFILSLSGAGYLVNKQIA